jgi:hypothetical protein
MDENEVKKEYTLRERLLLPVALVIGILFDRLMYRLFDRDMPELWGVFWLCFLAIFCAFYWKRLKNDKVLWYVAACAAALCLWSLFYDFAAVNNKGYHIITVPVIPGVLMAHAVMTAGEFKLKDAGSIAFSWLLGWVIKPFSGLAALFGAAGSLASGGRRPLVRKAAIGGVIALPLIGLLILPLLSGADMVFGYYLGRMTENWDAVALVRSCFIKSSRPRPSSSPSSGT